MKIVLKILTITVKNTLYNAIKTKYKFVTK